MNKKIISSAKNLTIWILNFSILCLILTSLFPLISVPENDAVKEYLFFNYEMMKNSDNFEITNLIGDIDLINLLFWALIIISLISFFCITYLTFLKRWYPRILAIISSVILIFSILLIFLQYSFIKAVSNIDYIDLSSVFLAIKYFHIILFFSILLLLCSILYTLHILLDLWRKILYSKSKKSKLKKTNEKPEDLPIKPIIDKKITISSESLNKKVKLEKRSIQEAQDISKKPVKDIYTPQEEVIKPIEITPEEQNYVNDKIITISEKKAHLGPFALEKRDVKPKNSEEPKPAKFFEEALSSAIEKKQSEFAGNGSIKPKTEEMSNKLKDISKEEYKQYEKIEEGKNQVNQPLIKKDIITNEIIVRCPQCKHVFATKKEGTTAKIECPNCGKEGII